jgi:hypothetical protein
MNPARHIISKLTGGGTSLAVMPAPIALEIDMAKKIVGWFPLVSKETGKMSDRLHYIEAHELDTVHRVYARCGMIEGAIERNIFRRIFKRKCRKCMVSERSDINARDRAFAKQQRLNKALYGHR